MSKFEHKLPTLSPGPLKKEILQCIQNTSVDEQNIRYGDYCDGIISGCGLVEENMKIGLHSGIVKFAGRLYKLREKTLVPYEPTDDWTILKLRFSPQIQHHEYTYYTAELVLDTELDMKPGEMEIGRFKLKRGSRLRTVYKDFWDMDTEYDTVNLIYVQQSARYAPTLSPLITTHFAREAFRHLSDNSLDCAFCTSCLGTGEPLTRELISRYVCNRLGRDYEEMDNRKLHTALAEVLDLIAGRTRGDLGKGHKRGVMLIN